MRISVRPPNSPGPRGLNLGRIGRTERRPDKGRLGHSARERREGTTPEATGVEEDPAEGHTGDSASADNRRVGLHEHRGDAQEGRYQQSHNGHPRRQRGGEPKCPGEAEQRDRSERRWKIGRGLEGP